LRTAAAKASLVAKSRHAHFFNGAESVNWMGKVNAVKRSTNRSVMFVFQCTSQQATVSLVVRPR